MAFNQIVFFGDSLTDNGNLSALVSEPGEPVPPAPYVDGVFSNGPVYSDTLVDLLGVESQNFALVSARAIESRPINDYLAGLGLETPADVDGFDINLNAQVDRFVDENTGEDLSDTAAAILIGANDLNNIEFASSPLIAALQAGQAVNQIAENVTEAAEDLAEAGVGTLIYYNLPPATFFPAIAFADPSVLPFADLAVNAVNTQVVEELNSSAALSDVEITVIELDRIAQEVADNRESFGFVADQFTTPVTENPADPLVPNFDLAGLDEDQYLFWDIVHPTTALHNIFAAFSDASLNKTTRFLDDGDTTARFGNTEDFVLASGGNDDISAGRGEDLVFGGLGDDTLSGGAGDDILSGDNGDDDLEGNLGADILSGGIGDDTLSGNAGNDLLIGGDGNDEVYGNRGDDVLVFVEQSLTTGGTSNDLYAGGNGNDTLYVVLDEEAFEVVSQSDDQIAALEDEVGLEVLGIETIILLESRDELGTEIAALGYEEAELWGFV